MTDREEPVFVCGHCGRGFVVRPPTKIDPYPVWSVGTTDDQPRSEGPCLGPIQLTYRNILIRNLDNAENSRNDR